VRNRLILGALAALAILTYLPVLSQPFIADDFVNIWRARDYAPPSGWKNLVNDPVHLYRPIFIFPTYWLDRIFGPWPPAFYALSILLHVGVTWLVYALGFWDRIGWRVSAIAAAFFAVQEGHQEAVMWYSAIYELYLALFLLLCLIAWIAWLRSPSDKPLLQTASLVCFVLALASKESAVMVIPLLVLPLLFERAWLRRGLGGLVPFAVLSLAWFGWMFLGGADHQRLGDGSFSLRAPVLITWLHSFGRLLWVFGVLSLATLVLLRDKTRWKLLLLAGLWISLALLPYCLLTYMTRLPSRQTYVASIGLSWIVAAAFLALWDRLSKRHALVVLVGFLVIAANVGYLWTRKRAQFRERTVSTQALIRLARFASGPVYVERFPFPLAIAQGAVLLGTGKSPDTVVWEMADPPSQGLADYRFSLTPVRTPADQTPATR